MRVLDWGIPLGIIVAAVIWFLGYNAVANPAAADVRENAKIIIHQPAGDAQAEPDQKRLDVLAAFASGTAYSDTYTSVTFSTIGDCGLQMTARFSPGNYMVKTWICGVTTRSEVFEDLDELEAAAQADPAGSGLAKFFADLRFHTIIGILTGG